MTKEAALIKIMDRWAGGELSRQGSAEEAYDAGYEAGKAEANEVEWHEINGVDSLPKVGAYYWAEKNGNLFSFELTEVYYDDWLADNCTHYAKITMPKAPELPKTTETPSDATQ